MPPRTVVIIGAGVAGLAASCCLAQAGFEVVILEKLQTPGGRARQFKEQGYTFDMGPSWYWMPEVFERFFAKFQQSTSDFYQLQRLDPSYQLIFHHAEKISMPADFHEILQTFEHIEPGSGRKLEIFLQQAGEKYQTGMNSLVYLPGNSVLELISVKLLKRLFQLDIFRSFESHIRKYFQDPRLHQALSFPVMFLGASPAHTPALYSLMNYADLKLGTWYPEGGMFSLIKAMASLAASLGVDIRYNQEVNNIKVASGRATGVETEQDYHPADVILAAADYHYVDQVLVPESFRQYSTSYWTSRKLAPSSLIFYLGIDRKIPGLLHHNLFFDADFDTHIQEIYSNPNWPAQPLFYVCATSKTDPSTCPPGHENVFVLIPVAPGLKDSPEIRDRYYHLIIERMEKNLGCAIKPHVHYCRSYAHDDFIADYHAFRGNAYGLANTLRQTAMLKPRIRSSKVKNLFFTGQLTLPGPGLPPCVISGEVVSQEIIRHFRPAS